MFRANRAVERRSYPSAKEDGFELGLLKMQRQFEAIGRVASKRRLTIGGWLRRIFHARPAPEENGRSPGVKRSARTVAREGVIDEQRIQPRELKLLALFAHELRSPLAAINNAVELLRLRGDDASIRVLAQGTLDRQSRQLVALVEEMLRFSRLSLGDAPLEKQTVDLAEIVFLAVEAVRPAVDHHGQTLEVALPDSPAALEGSRTLLVQMLTNLLGNAAKFSVAGGRIQLTASLEREDKRECLVLRVRDSGVGIAREEIPLVFGLFWRSSGTPGHTTGGLGIGLPLVRLIAELHGGTVSAASDGLNRGSEFIVRLPRST